MIGRPFNLSDASLTPPLGRADVHAAGVNSIPVTGEAP